MRYHLLILLLSLLPLGALGQTPYEIYQDSAGGNMPLLRGKVATKYKFNYNGVYTWDRNGFQEGEVTLEGKLYKNLKLEINAHQQKLLVQYPGSFTIIELPTESVRSFSRGEDTYINLQLLGHKVPKGFYRIVYQGKETVFERIDKEFVRDVALDNDGRIGYKDPDFKYGVFEAFIAKKSYYFLNESGVLERFGSTGYILNKHKSRKRDIKQFVKTHGLGKADLATWCKEVMSYLENNHENN